MEAIGGGLGGEHGDEITVPLFEGDRIDAEYTERFERRPVNCGGNPAVKDAAQRIIADIKAKTLYSTLITKRIIVNNVNIVKDASRRSSRSVRDCMQANQYSRLYGLSRHLCLKRCQCQWPPNGLRVSHAVEDGCKVQRRWEAPNLSTWP